MKDFFERYLNEIVGLAIMALMTMALVAGQAQAGADGAVIEAARDVIEIRLTISD